MFLAWNAMSECTRLVNWRETYEEVVVMFLKAKRQHSLVEAKENK